MATSQLPRSEYPAEYQVENQGRLVSYSQPAPGIEPATFLRYASGRPRFYWRDGRTGVTFAGMGVAADLMAWGERRIPAIDRQTRALFAHAVSLHSTDPLAAPRSLAALPSAKILSPILPGLALTQRTLSCPTISWYNTTKRLG